MLSLTDNMWRYKSLAEFAICSLSAIFAFGKRYAYGVWGLYHIESNKVRHIATEQREVISHSRSEYIAEQKKRGLTDIFVLSSFLYYSLLIFPPFL